MTFGRLLEKNQHFPMWSFFPLPSCRVWCHGKKISADQSGCWFFFILQTSSQRFAVHWPPVASSLCTAIDNRPQRLCLCHQSHQHMVIQHHISGHDKLWATPFQMLTTEPKDAICDFYLFIFFTGENVIICSDRRSWGATGSEVTARILENKPHL